MMRMYDPKTEYSIYKDEIDNSIKKVINHGLFINGPEVKELEEKLSKFVGVKHAICVSSGTDAITISLLAMNVQPEDEIITVAHSSISNAASIALVKAKPIFVDIEKIYYNMDHSKIENLITKKTKGIIVVSLYGQMANIDEINEIAQKHNLFVIEDGAQSFGATYKDKKSGSLTTLGTTSFCPSMPLGCYGNGGACFTNDDTIAEKIKAIKNYGSTEPFNYKYIGLNSRLDTIQASILLEKLNYFDESIENRINKAQYYTENLDFLKTQGFILPVVNEDNTSVWAQYSILALSKMQRDSIVEFLKKYKNIDTTIFYPSPLHLQNCFSYLNYNKQSLPVTEEICNRVFNIPIYAEISREDQDYVIDSLKGFSPFIKKKFIKF